MTGTTEDRPKRRRTAKQDMIAQTLRSQIVSKKLSPGARLPNQLELVKRFGASAVTVQRALEQLARDGLVVSRPRQGVFVDPHPPHLVDYGLVFPHEPTRMAQENRFLFSLSQIAAGLSANGPKRSSIYYALERPDDSRAYHELLDQVQRLCMAGLIFLSPPLNFTGTPILTTEGIPRAAIMGGQVLPGVTAIRLGSYTAEAMTWLGEQQSRRLAVITSPTSTEEALGEMMALAAGHGADLPRRRIFAVPSIDPRWARYVVQELMERTPDERPDGLLITDDNLVPYATAGLLAAGIRVPEQCRVAAHGNFPWLTESLVPARRFGPDTHEVFQACLDVIDRGRRGEPMPEFVNVSFVSS